MKIKNVEQLRAYKSTKGYETRAALYNFIKVYQHYCGRGCWQVVKLGRYYYGYLDNAHAVGE